jgi:hypothetical protein
VPKINVMLHNCFLKIQAQYWYIYIVPVKQKKKNQSTEGKIVLNMLIPGREAVLQYPYVSHNSNIYLVYSYIFKKNTDLMDFYCNIKRYASVTLTLKHSK